MPSSSFLDQRRSGSVPGSQLLLRILITGWQFKFIWVRLEFLLRGTGWRMEFTIPQDGLPPAAYLGKTRVQKIRLFFHFSAYDSPIETAERLPYWHWKVDIVLAQLWFFSQQYRVPGSNVTIDEAMILFTSRSIHITKMPNKPISQHYKFFWMAEKGYVMEFNPSSNAVGGNPVDGESRLLQLTDTGKLVHHLTTRLHQRHRKLSFNVYMDNFFTTQSLLAEIRGMGIGASGTCRRQFQGFPKELKVGKNAKLPYHFRSWAVNDGVATLLWMDSSPVTMMSTIHPLSSEVSLVTRMRKHPGNKNTNASGANSTFLSRERQKELDIPVIVDAYNQHKVGEDVADQYRPYYNSQLISRRNWYPLFYCILETALINSLIIYRDLWANTERTVDHVDFHPSIVHDLLQLEVHQQWEVHPIFRLRRKSLSWLPPHNLPCPHCLPGRLPRTPLCPSAERYQECIPHCGWKVQ